MYSARLSRLCKLKEEAQYGNIDLVGSTTVYDRQRGTSVPAAVPFSIEGCREPFKLAGEESGVCWKETVAFVSRDNQKMIELRIPSEGGI